MDADFKVQVINPGNGVKPQKGQKCKVHYKGYLANGTCFDKSDKDAGGFQFVLGAGKVIKGFEEGVKQMSKGEKSKIFIPANMGYGAKGTNGILPNANLVFEIDLIDFK